MKRNLFAFILTSLAGLLLSSCSLLGDLLSSLNQAQNATNGVTSRASEGDGWSNDNTRLPNSLASIGESSYTAYLPAQGHVNLLVLPIEFTDFPFSQQTLSDLSIALGGTAEQTGYWESVASFYEKSSFGKVHLHFEIADKFACGMTQEAAYNAYNSTGGKTDNGVTLIRNAYNQYKAKKDATDPTYIRTYFDADTNGWIDGIIAVYSGHSFKKGNLTYDANTNYYWAYTYWAVASETGSTLTWTNPDLNSPTPNLYFWLSYDFMYDAVSQGSGKVDAHTLIHETGHMFGLDDYYPDENSKFHAAGCWAMMDQNILDHDVFSKMILGWANPIIANASGSVEINPSSSSGDCIVFPTGNWNGTLFDEYILVELYTPTDLNYQDSHVLYPNRQLGYTIPGIKIYHVDARLVRYDKQSYALRYEYVSDYSSLGQLSYNSPYGYSVGASNCRKSQKANRNFSLLHLMEATGINTFANGGYGTNATLFQAGQSFSLSAFGQNFFPNKTAMNNNSSFPYVITVNSVSSSKASISFIKA